MKKDEFNLQQWIAWLATSVVTAISIVIFFYQHFETKESLEDYKKHQEKFQGQLEKRLDRIENQLDQLLVNHGN